MARLAEATGSVISAVLFGALAGAGALPFARKAFEAAIRRGGVGVEASLAAFDAGFAAARPRAAGPEAAEPSAGTHSTRPRALLAKASAYPEPARAFFAQGSSAPPTIRTPPMRACIWTG